MCVSHQLTTKMKHFFGGLRGVFDGSTQINLALNDVKEIVTIFQYTNKLFNSAKRDLGRRMTTCYSPCILFSLPVPFHGDVPGKV